MIEHENESMGEVGENENEEEEEVSVVLNTLLAVSVIVAGISAMALVFPDGPAWIWIPAVGSVSVMLVCLALIEEPEEPDEET